MNNCEKKNTYCIFHPHARSTGYPLLHDRRSDGNADFKPPHRLSSAEAE